MQDGGTRRPSGASPDGEQGAQKSRVDVCRAKERKEKGLCKYNGWEGLRHEGKPESRLAYEMPSLTCTPYTEVKASGVNIALFRGLEWGACRTYLPHAQRAIHHNFIF